MLVFVNDQYSKLQITDGGEKGKFASDLRPRLVRISVIQIPLSI